VSKCKLWSQIVQDVRNKHNEIEDVKNIIDNTYNEITDVYEYTKENNTYLSVKLHNTNGRRIINLFEQIEPLMNDYMVDFDEYLSNTNKETLDGYEEFKRIYVDNTGEEELRSFTNMYKNLIYIIAILINCYKLGVNIVNEITINYDNRESSIKGMSFDDILHVYNKLNRRVVNKEGLLRPINIITYVILMSMSG